MSDYIKCDVLVNNRTKECRYYSSDLNKFLAEECERNMAIGNIDVWQYKIIDNIHYIRLIESKHVNENTNKWQAKVFEFLNSLFSICKILNVVFEFYYVIGNYPYDSVVVKKVDGRHLKLNQEEFKQWLNFEKSFILLNKKEDN